MDSVPAMLTRSACNATPLYKANVMRHTVDGDLPRSKKCKLAHTVVPTMLPFGRVWEGRDRLAMCAELHFGLPEKFDILCYPNTGYMVLKGDIELDLEKVWNEKIETLEMDVLSQMPNFCYVGVFQGFGGRPSWGGSWTVGYETPSWQFVQTSNVPEDFLPMKVKVEEKKVKLVFDFAPARDFYWKDMGLGKRSTYSYRGALAEVKLIAPRYRFANEVGMRPAVDTDDLDVC